MVVQVGDKVLVYGAGTPWAFAKKIEPVEVGDKVDVLTLSDGTKLAMPRIELDLHEYVWVIPTWDTPFHLDGMPFSWEMMPLGAAVFTLTGVLNCYQLEDINREWEIDQISGKKLVIYKLNNGRQTCIIYTITGWVRPYYSVVLNSIDFTYDLWTDLSISDPDNYAPPKSISPSLVDMSMSWEGTRVHSIVPTLKSPDISFAGIKQIEFSYRYKSRAGYRVGPNNYIYNHHPVAFVFGEIIYCPLKTIYETVEGELITFLVNINYPGYSGMTIDVSSAGGGLTYILIGLQSHGGGSLSKFFAPIEAEFTGVNLIPSDCQTEDSQAGDKYVIYDPETKKLVLNDGSKTILAAAYWRDITGPNEEISTTPVTYAWDGQGQVYLSQSKTTLSTIFYDNELQVSNLAAGKTKTIPYHSNDPYILEGETVSRELVNITSILRAGNNEITLFVRDTAGNKVGFPTPVYIMRSMS